MASRNTAAIFAPGNRNKTFRCSAPAKINLGLRVVARREDGYHELESLFVPLDLADEIAIEIGDAGSTGVEVEVVGRNRGVPTDGTNLAARAATAFSKAPDITPLSPAFWFWFLSLKPALMSRAIAAIPTNKTMDAARMIAVAPRSPCGPNRVILSTSRFLRSTSPAAQAETLPYCSTKKAGKS